MNTYYEAVKVQLKTKMPSLTHQNFTYDHAIVDTIKREVGDIYPVNEAADRMKEYIRLNTSQKWHEERGTVF